MPNISESSANCHKIEINNAFHDDGDTVVYYYRHQEKQKHGVVDRKTCKKERLTPGTVLVITAMEKENMCDTKMTYIDYGDLDKPLFDIKFQPENDVVWIEKIIYIPASVTRWTFTITFKEDARPYPLLETHAVTIGEEKPGT
jgi:hypothetical protein